jgi:hypothetical protein
MIYPVSAKMPTKTEYFLFFIKENLFWLITVEQRLTTAQYSLVGSNS